MAEIEGCFATRLQLNGMSHKTISLTRWFWPEQSWLLKRNSVRFRHRSIVWLNLLRLCYSPCCFVFIGRSRRCERRREQGFWWATPASVTTTRGSLAACVGMCVIQGLQGLINTHNLQFVSHYSFLSLSPSLALSLSCTLFLSVSTLICDCVLLFIYIFIHSRFECTSPHSKKTSEYFRLSAERGWDATRVLVSSGYCVCLFFVFGQCFHVYV